MLNLVGNIVYKSTLPGDVPLAMLQMAGPPEISFLTATFKEFLKMNYIPNKWRELILVFITKVEKTNHSAP